MVLTGRVRVSAGREGSLNHYSIYRRNTYINIETFLSGMWDQVFSKHKLFISGLNCVYKFKDPVSDAALLHSNRMEGSKDETLC